MHKEGSRIIHRMGVESFSARGGCRIVSRIDPQLPASDDSTITRQI